MSCPKDSNVFKEKNFKKPSNYKDFQIELTKNVEN